MAKDPADVSLLDIYKAVEGPKVFAIHQYEPKKPCEVSCHIKAALTRVLERAQKSMEKSLGQITLANVIADMKKG